jgi:uncharacterized sulfatase
VIEVLRENGLLDDTIIVFMSDHGDALGEHGMVNKGVANYESIVRVPCIMRWPDRLPAGRRISGMVEAVDIFPTLCELAEVPIPKGVKGRDMGSLLRGETDQGRASILIEHKNPTTGFSVKTLRTEEFKYFRYNDDREVLYDLREEDQEVFNRADDPKYAADIADLRGRLLSRLIAAEEDLPEKTHPY